jgi:hypothetical protein
MKRVIGLTALLGLLAMGCISVKGNVHVEEEEHKEASVLRHVVVFKFKPGSSEADIEKVCAAFRNLKNGIDTVRSIESGKDISPENLQHGFTHCFIVTFDNPAGRDTYLTHPVHNEFVKLAGLHLEDVLVVDFIP